MGDMVWKRVQKIAGGGGIWLGLGLWEGWGNVDRSQGVGACGRVWVIGQGCGHLNLLEILTEVTIMTSTLNHLIPLKNYF